jgi:PAS domain S-box-containing protein
LEAEQLWATGEMAERIRAFDWASTPLGCMHKWPQTLTTMLNMVLDNPVPMVLIWGRKLVMLHNDAYQTMMNAPHHALGGSYLAAWGAIKEIVTPQIERAFAGELVRVERQGFDVLQADGGFVRRFFDYSFSPVRDENGEVAGLLHIGFEITSRERAYKALSASEARLRAAIDNVPVGVAIIDTNGEFVISNDQYRRYLPAGKMPSRDPEIARQWQAWDEDGLPVEPDLYPGARALRGESGASRMEFLFTDDVGREIWTDVATAPIMDSYGKVTGAASVITDITEQKRTAERLSQSEKRSAFLLKISDALRQLSDASAIKRTACTILGEHLSADWAFYVDYSVEAGFGIVDQEFAADGLPSLSGRYAMEEFGSTSVQLANGQIWVVSDARNEHQITRAERDYYVERNVISWINVPLIKGGKLEAMLCIVQSKSRTWSDVEIEVVEEAAERLWATVARARAETALRESEARLKTLIDGVPQLIWRAEAGGKWIWASPQWEEHTGQAIEDSLGRGWLEAIHPEDRESVEQSWSAAERTGRLDVKARIATAAMDDCRWFQIRAAPVRNEAGKIIEWLGTSTDIHDLRELQARQSVLVDELQHRTRNLIGVVKAISRRTLQRSESLLQFERRFGDRLAALSRVQGLLSNLSAGQRVTFDELLNAELSAIAAPEERVLLKGPGGIELRSATVQTMALALHELATNATKHGALSCKQGQLQVTWNVAVDAGEQRLHVEWHETGVALDDREIGEPNSGFGRELIEWALPYQLKARTTFKIGSDGIHCTIDVPVAAKRS